jgi:hypothetical protein
MTTGVLAMKHYKLITFDKAIGTCFGANMQVVYLLVRNDKFKQKNYSREKPEVTPSDDESMNLFPRNVLRSFL